MIKTIPFEPEHLINIEKNDIDSETVDFIGNIEERAKAYFVSGPGLTVVDECDPAIGDTILATGGLCFYWQGVGELWMLISPKGRKHGAVIYKAMSEFIQSCFDVYGCHRVQTSVMCNNSIAHKSTLRLGFIPEGMMVAYGPRKENYIRYVKLAGGV